MNEFELKKLLEPAQKFGLLVSTESISRSNSKEDKQHLPLQQITSTVVSTSAAAFYLCRKPQTLRTWASRGSGPIRPLNIHGRLAWPVADIRRLLEVNESSGVVTFGRKNPQNDQHQK
jgi:hypothetical protein